MQAGIIGESAVEAQRGAGRGQVVAPLLSSVQTEKDLPVGDGLGAVKLREQQALAYVTVVDCVLRPRASAYAALESHRDQQERERGLRLAMAVHEFHCGSILAHFDLEK